MISYETLFGIHVTFITDRYKNSSNSGFNKKLINENMWLTKFNVLCCFVRDTLLKQRQEVKETD